MSIASVRGPEEPIEDWIHARRDLLADLLASCRTQAPPHLAAPLFVDDAHHAGELRAVARGDVGRALLGGGLAAAGRHALADEREVRLDLRGLERERLDRAGAA